MKAETETETETSRPCRRGCEKRGKVLEVMEMFWRIGQSLVGGFEDRGAKEEVSRGSGRGLQDERCN